MKRAMQTDAASLVDSSEPILGTSSALHVRPTKPDLPHPITVRRTQAKARQDAVFAAALA
jgi:hypothetical protein